LRLTRFRRSIRARGVALRAKGNNPMTHDNAVDLARKVARDVLVPHAADNDKQGRFSTESVHALGDTGLLALSVPAEFGGAGLGPRAFAEVVAILAEADASVGMVYTMHTCATQCYVAGAARSEACTAALGQMAKGAHLATLAFSERGSRSHFWAPVSRAERVGDRTRLNAQKSWVTSAGMADSYVVSSQVPGAKGPTDTALYLVRKDAGGIRVAAPWDGLGLRANASSPMTLEACEVGRDALVTEEGGGFRAMLDVVLPWFCLGSAGVALGLCRASVASTIAHLKTTAFEHMSGAKLGEALPNLRANLASMQTDTDGLAARMLDVVDHLEKPSDVTMLRVLEAKASAGETAIVVTQDAMRTCGGAAFSRHTGIERFFRDAQAGAVMAPTVEVVREFIGKALLGIPLF
jgi:alkylation response protein AidB-like acyl-CoA dehydrogenase